MAVLVVAMLILAMTGYSNAAWCVCKQDLSEGVLQKTLDYACGAGADCNPTKQNGPCFSPNTVRAHCSYAVNSFFQKKGQAATACDFAGTATVTTSNPSSAGCSYPTGVSTGTGSTTVSPTPVTTTPSTGTTTSPITGTTTTTTPTTATPYSGTSSTGVLGGAGTMGPSGTDTDYSDAGFRLHHHFISLFAIISIVPMFFWV